MAVDPRLSHIDTNADADAENVRFLRALSNTDMDTDMPDLAPGPPASDDSNELRHRRLIRDMDRFERPLPPDAAATSHLNHPNPATRTTHDDQDQSSTDGSNRQMRLQRAFHRYNRIFESARADSARAYGDRIPLPAQQSLYDWAPRQDPARDDYEDLGEIISELRRQHSTRSTELQDPQMQDLLVRELLRRRELEDEARSRWGFQRTRNEAQQRGNETLALERRNESLRSAAILQNARSSVRSPSGTERMLRYLRTRERTGQRTEGDREEPTEPANPPSMSTLYTGTFGAPQGSRYESNRLAWQTQQPLSQNNRTSDTAAAPAMATAVPSTAATAAAADDRRRDLETRARIDAYRRGYLAESPPSERNSPSTPLSPLLENAVKYLDRLRACSAYEDSLSSAIDHGLATTDFFGDNHDDFVRNTYQCPPPAPSSWLQPGAVFQGSQNTASTNESSHHALRSWTSPTHSNHDPSRPFDATRPWMSHTPAIPTAYLSTGDSSLGHVKDMQDRWPVKVTIQAVDHDKMTMAGTMEAYDVPNTSSSVTSILASSSSTSLTTFPPFSLPLHDQRSATSKKNPPITTYLEGQIIDFSTYTFLTPSTGQTASAPANSSSSAPRLSRLPIQAQDIVFPPTSAVTDAENWRNLPPFNAMKSDDEVARTLLSSSRMSDIMSEWVFMRWKERCFIHSKSDSCHRGSDTPSVGVLPIGEGDDTDTGHGLTISGFYYVSLRRNDGKIEGLYFDTKTSPYQHLRLDSERGGLRGAWDFK